MNYDDEERYNGYDDDDLNYNNDFGNLMRQRHGETRRNSAYGRFSDEYVPRTQRKYGSDYDGAEEKYRGYDSQQHYIPRNPNRIKARQRTQSRYVGRRHTGQSNSSVKLAERNRNYGRAASSSHKGEHQISHSTVIVSTVCILIVMTVIVSMVVKSLYTSKSMFSDDGANGDNDTTIQERLITSKENKDKVTYFLIVGVDKSSMLTDCIWLMCFDNQAHQMNVMQIPRDTYVGSASQNHKINTVYASPKTVNWCSKCNRSVEKSEIKNKSHIECGNKVSKKTESNISALIRYINDHLGMPVDHYVLFDFDGFEKVIDAMGGVDITLDEKMKVYPNKHEYEVLPAGDNHLDGEMALKFMRNRQIYADGDLGRVKAQRKIIHSMMDKVMDMSAMEVFSVLTAAYGNFNTDMSLEEIRSFISPVKKCGTDALNMFEMPGEAHWVKPNPSYYVCHKKETLTMINEYLLPYGDKLTAEDINFPTPID